MNKPKNDPGFSEQAKLREKAELKLKIDNLLMKKPATEADIMKVIHELQVYQIELQLQNEELILAREKAELAEKKYTELYEFAPSGYLSLSLEGDILELNHSAAKLLHKKRSQLINNRLALFITEDTRAVFNDFLLKVINHKDKETCEVTIEIEGFELIYTNVDGIISKDGQAILLSIVDITKSKQAEESLAQLEITKESLKFKQRFLANISHEIRTPLTGVLGMIDILERTELNKVQKDYLDILKLSGDNLRMIINQVLDYSQIEAGKLVLVPTAFAFHSLFAEISAQFKERIKKGVTFDTQPDPDIPEIIYADKERIGQIITNFVSNAIKFTPKGSISLRSKLLPTEASTKQLQVKISVTDTGIGIPEEMQGKLFVPFSQIDNKDTRNYEGTGLGLSICKELAMLLGGEIGFESQCHKGSTFWFSFPAELNAPIQIPSNTRQKDDTLVSENKPHPNGKLRILFADDKVVNQKVVSLMLQSIGHDVILASNGQEALQAYKPGKFDLILMDIQMPVMDGITATQILKQKFKDPPPIVGLSANAFEGDREKYLAMGMDEYLTKPLNIVEFKQMTSRLYVAFSNE